MEGGVDRSFDFSADRNLPFGDEKIVRHIVTIALVTVLFVTPSGKMAEPVVDSMFSRERRTLTMVGACDLDGVKAAKRPTAARRSAATDDRAAGLEPPSAGETDATPTKRSTMAKDGANDATSFTDGRRLMQRL